MDELFASIERAGLDAAEAAMGRGGEMVRDRAKELAPVRKVFAGQSDRVRTRLKSIDEIEADRSIRARLNLGPEDAWIYPPSTITRRPPQMLAVRSVVRESSGNRMRRPSAQSGLDRRGRYELKSGRAVTSRDQLGGTLRDAIFVTEVVVEGRMIRVSVVSPTPYAKYQEFGTRHNPAHPYLRPAGHESKDMVMRDVRSSVARAAQAAAKGSVRINVMWHMKAG